MRGKRILITGAAGFIGSNMTDLLSDENEVVGIDNFSNVDDRFIRPLIEDKKVRFEKADTIPGRKDKKHAHPLVLFLIEIL